MMPFEEMLGQAHRGRLDDPLGTLRALCVGTLNRLGTDARTCAVFDVIFHKCDVGDASAASQLRRDAVERACLHRVEGVIRQAIARGQLPADTNAPLAAQGTHAYMVGLMHQWVLDPGAYNLARAAPALIDTWLAGLAARPPRRAGKRNAPRRTRTAPRAPAARPR
jgi:TetR/AcrR family acrAB operon transcriptional repressor